MKKILNIFTRISNALTPSPLGKVGMGLFVLFLLSCEPQQDEKIELPTAPTATFAYKAGKDANHIILKNTTAGAFLTQWDLGNGTKSTEAEFEAYFPYKGEFEVTLTAFNKGGHGTATQKISIAQDDPNACFGAIALLSDCSEKTWKLKPAAGSLTVGTPGLTQVYWAISDADVATRACAYNDEYKFTSKGVFQYDNKGDFWGDADGNNNPIPAGIGVKVGCNAASALKAPFDVWGSGTHKFSATNDQLTLSGKGAWMGLYKVGTNAEVTEPQSSVTYKIIKLTKTELVIAAVYASLEWRFTLVAQ
jgi:PKD repeat protein